LVKDIKPGPKGSSPWYLTSLGDRIVFGADDGVHGGELWSSDGTAAGTMMIRELTTGPEGTNMAWFNRVGRSVYFTAITPDVGLEPWRTNGLSGQLVADLSPGEGWSHVQDFVRAGDHVYFTSDANLWRSDDAWPEADLEVVADPDPEFGSLPKGGIASANGRVYFVSSNWDPFGPTFIYPRWSDGETISSLTGPPVEQLPLYQSIPDSFTEFGGRTFFVINDVEHGSELRVVNGDKYRLFDDILEGESSSRPRDFTRSKNYLYFTADDGIHGREVWRIRK
jgi:ELWxxDGT repeat protein